MHYVLSLMDILKPDMTNVFHKNTTFSFFVSLVFNASLIYGLSQM